MDWQQVTMHNASLMYLYTLHFVFVNIAMLFIFYLFSCFLCILMLCVCMWIIDILNVWLCQSHPFILLFLLLLLSFLLLHPVTAVAFVAAATTFVATFVLSALSSDDELQCTDNYCCSYSDYGSNCPLSSLPGIIKIN